jgi:serine phosphatase RsbU (regulator of sigma subunit)
VVEGLEYDDAEATLQPGQRLVLYTDGVTEARSRISREFYHESRLKDLLSRHAKEHLP